MDKKKWLYVKLAFYNVIIAILVIILCAWAAGLFVLLEAWL